MEIVRDADATGEPILVLAGGSNVVVGDAGFPSTVLLIRTLGISAQVSGDDVTVTVAAGEPWDGVVARTVAEKWSGLECLSGIPGSAGATPIQNVGAYGQEVAERITSVRALDRRSGTVVTMSAAECGFGYRTSVFKHVDRWIVLSVDFALTRSARSAPIRYAELAAKLGVAAGERADAGDAREGVLDLRRGKGMVLDPGDPDTYSVGSFFMNPVLSASEHAAFTPRAAEFGPVAAWPERDGGVKISAAWLIERAGFPKGYARGGVAISSKHTLALTNRGSGTTEELLGLAREIRAGVNARFGVTLRPEPVLVNCEI
jgi:UDP-N-acetylmuramate dehydrogenase